MLSFPNDEERSNFFKKTDKLEREKRKGLGYYMGYIVLGANRLASVAVEMIVGKKVSW